MKLIGLVGRKSSGKDTAAIALELQGYGVAKFAGALKAMTAAYLDYIGVGLDAQKVLIEDCRVKEIPSPYFNGRSPRFIMQTLGTEWGRDTVSPSIWVDACMRHCALFKKVVITDVRFPNEVEAIKKHGGTTIRIIRPGLSTADQHSSETLIDSLAVDHEICNDGAIEDLHEAILQLEKGI